MVDSELGAPAASSQASVWRDHLYWHRKMYRGARFRWFGYHVIDEATWLTRGKLDFTSLPDLGVLSDVRERAGVAARAVMGDVGVQLRLAHAVIGDEQLLIELLGLSQLELRMALAQAQVARGGPRNRQVERITQKLQTQLLSNPLIAALELTQAWRLHLAVQDMLEDTLCDLVVELEQSRPMSVIVERVGMISEAQLRSRVADARSRRGEPGDARRIPEQRLIHDERQ